MAHKSTFETKFRRRREGKTNYKKRLALIRSEMKRLVVRTSNKYVLVQLIEFDRKGDKTVTQAHSKELKHFGWNASCKNLPAAYLTGLLCGVRTGGGKEQEATLDIGFNTPVHGCRAFAALKGALDAGLKVKFGENALPSEERVTGKHIESFSKKDIIEIFNKCKENILKQRKGEGNDKGKK